MPGKLVKEDVEMTEKIQPVDDTVKKDKKIKKEKKKKETEKDEAFEQNGNANEEQTPKKKKKKKNKTKQDSGDEKASEAGEKSQKSSKRKLESENDEAVSDSKKPKMCEKEPEDDQQSNSGSSKEDAELSVEEQEGALEKFSISDVTKEKLLARGVKYLFPIQAKTFDFIQQGSDLIAQARTGTGKTLSFALPLVERLQENTHDRKRGRSPKVLVMAPTRELAKQVMDDFESISDNLSVFCIYGGTPYGPQESAIRNGLDILVGTPGRILDYVQKGTLDLSQLKHVVLDEVDQMLDMGFAESVGEILQAGYNTETPDSNPQTLLFSATLPPWVHETAKKYMKQDSVKRIDLVGQQLTRTATTVQHMAIKCSYFDRASTVGLVVQRYSGNHGRCIVFCQTKRDADELATCSAIKQEAHVLHGDIPQDKRELVLKKFREGKYKCLVTTDVAARGLDIPEIDLVVQCSPPKDVDSYIHRSGRTGRAGRQGVCICFYKPNEEWDLKTVERRAGITFKRIGAPTTNDLIDTAAKDAVKSLEGISDSTLDHFKELAESLIEERGAVAVLSAALAVISGHTTIKSRSLQNSQEGYTTYLFRTNMELERVGYVWRSLERLIPVEVKDTISRMRMCKDKMGCIFDLPSEHDQVIVDNWQDGKYDTLEKATELPELMESFDSPGRGFGGGGRGFNGGGRGRGGGGRGRGSFGGRGGGRGGFRGSPRGSPRGGGGFRGGRGGGFKQSISVNGSGGQNKKKTFD